MLRQTTKAIVASKFANCHRPPTICQLFNFATINNKSRGEIDRSRPLPPPAYAATRLDKVPPSDQDHQEVFDFKNDPPENHAYEFNEPGQSSSLKGSRSEPKTRASNRPVRDHLDAVKDHQKAEEAFDQQFGAARFTPHHQGHQDDQDILTNMTQREEHAYDQDRETWRAKDPRSGNDARTYALELQANYRFEASKVRHGDKLPGEERRDKITERAEFDKREIFGRDTAMSGTRDRDLAEMRILGLMDDDQPEREIQDHARKCEPKPKP